MESALAAGAALPGDAYAVAIAVTAITVFGGLAVRNDLIRGSGLAVTVEGVTGTDFTADLSGTGTLEVSGSVDRLTPVLSGLGTVALHGLVAHDAIARLEGTGDVEVHATSAIDAALTGTGSIVYSGSPSVTAHNMGTGSITGV